MSYNISCRAHFDAAHFLKGHSGRCSNLHGHRWEIIACFEKDELIKEGTSRDMVVDFGDIKPMLKSIADSLDHTFIYEVGSLSKAAIDVLKDEGFELREVGFRPTAENFAKFFYDKLKNSGLCVKSVCVYETPDNCAEYSED